MMGSDDRFPFSALDERTSAHRGMSGHKILDEEEYDSETRPFDALDYRNSGHGRKSGHQILAEENSQNTEFDY